MVARRNGHDAKEKQECGYDFGRPPKLRTAPKELPNDLAKEESLGAKNIFAVV
jgi:hypothetical protein